MTSAIETFGLTKRYGCVTAVADLSLRVEPGQVFGFLGPNGAGKSTTIRLLMALQQPTRGRATLLGLKADADSVEVRRRVVDAEHQPLGEDRDLQPKQPAAHGAPLKTTSAVLPGLFSVLQDAPNWVLLRL